jgi:hypothetical protein
MPKMMKDENDSYLKPGQKDEDDSYVGKKSPYKPGMDKMNLPGKKSPYKPGMDMIKMTPEQKMNSRKRALRKRISGDRAMGTASSISATVRKTANRKDNADPKKIKSLEGMYINAKKGEAAGKKYLKSMAPKTVPSKPLVSPDRMK